MSTAQPETVDGRHSRVMVISQLPPPLHGSTLMTARLLDILAQSGWITRLVDRRFSQDIGQVGEASARKILLAIGLWWRTLWTTLTWKPRAVVFFATTRTGSFLVDWVVSEILRLCGARTVLYIHTVGFRDLAARGALWNFFVRRMLGSAHRIVTLGPTLVADVAPFVAQPESTVVCIANTPTGLPDALAPRLPTSRNVLFLSNIIPGKGADVFVSIALALFRDRDRATFALAGPAGDAALAENIDARIGEVDASHAITRLGAVAGETKWDALTGATCLAFTSELIEAQPLTIIEAMACGIPVVAFRVGGIPDLIEDGVTGFLVDAGDTATFEARVRTLLNDAVLRERMARAARTRFEQNFSELAFAGSWTAVLSETGEMR
ncbi:glycosyltransferase involved in cell wall biosynthesis [Mycetocola sp. BIGb0189]|uniref:glycosyltransferase family 4 protein n=1 Tax=Mycetocola sp. BIGb0189 TaxID=2940604 RepID=UPI0021699A27|nr:glycosyltransferase family 4 protein [Mycetocola sp. BIGb0189]MCS4275676.1 glycosyltransferase involved in cell wall biosynthesis [Mycetocola sp. BIGb0189]